MQVYRAVVDTEGLPDIEWRRPSSYVRNIWYVGGASGIVAVVDEVGSVVQTWSFYLLVGDAWEELVEFGSSGPPVPEIGPRFGYIVEYAPGLGDGRSCLLVIEWEADRIWWIIYCWLRAGGLVPLFALGLRIPVVVTECQEPCSDESDGSEDGIVRLVFDI
jgi:hypothetical protein